MTDDDVPELTDEQRFLWAMDKLGETQAKLFEAGKFAGHQALTIDRLRAIAVGLLAVLETVVEHGTDSPEHLAAEAVITDAREALKALQEDT